MTLVPDLRPAPDDEAPAPRCLHCRATLRDTFVDLGLSPLCQTHVAADALDRPETFYPLHARVCRECFLVQLEEFVAPADIFGEYAYFSSYSDSWVAHARRYALGMAQRLRLGAGSLVMEVASNDGYLLQHFVAQGVPVLGIEPAANVAEAARQRGVRTIDRFLGTAAAREIVAQFGHADLVVANNVLAHVPDINDFVSGLGTLLAPDGVLTLEFPHLRRLIESNQFDTIYHEHFSYLSLFVVERIFASRGLTVFDVEELPTHGGSLRVHAARATSVAHARMPAVDRVIGEERAAGLDTLAAYRSFGAQVQATKRDILAFLVDAKRVGHRIVGYGAPGKGNTLLNYCGIRTDFLDFTVDRNPYKQGKFTPGTRIPILAPDAIARARPDYVFVLPWNLVDEIVEQLGYVRDWGGKFVVPIPRVSVR
jgi:SAM-dependent methyltransferase